jgi:hypothetical protein
MTPEEQRIAIAEACGWTVKRWTDGEGNSVVGLLPPGVEKTSSSFRHSPDYLNDLNAMHDAEKVLDVNIESENSPRYEYSRQVYRIVESRRQPFRSTAAQRAEAFLRTLGKWEESA